MSNPADELVFIPCEICDEPVAMTNYTEHTNVCNATRFIQYHGMSLDEVLNPLPLIDQVQPTQPIMEFAGNLASSDEQEPDSEPEEEAEEPEEYEIATEDEGPIAGEPQPNVQVAAISALLRIFTGIDITNHATLRDQLQDIITSTNAMLDQQQANRVGDLEDVAVGLTPEQHTYALTVKLVTEPTTCNICCDENLNQLTTLICGHELCPPCANKHFTTHVKCPFCNQDLRDIINTTP